MAREVKPGDATPRVTTREAIKSNKGRLILVVVAAALLVGAVLLPDALPGWMRTIMALGGGDESAATPWLRGVFIAGALGLLLWVRSKGQVAWPEITLLVGIALITFAFAAAYKDARKKTEKEIAEVALFNVDAEKVNAATQLGEASPIIVLTVEPEKADTGIVLSYVSTRYEATLCRAVDPGEATEDVALTVERGKDDTVAAAFAADLRGAETVHLLPSASKSEEGEDEEDEDNGEDEGEGEEDEDKGDEDIRKKKDKKAKDRDVSAGCPDDVAGS